MSCLPPETLAELEARTEVCDHEWEYEDYDPSVGCFGGATCALCGAQKLEDRGDDDDDLVW